MSWTWVRFVCGTQARRRPARGASKPYWEPINDIYHLNITVVNPVIDPTFSFMTVDHDGVIRMGLLQPVRDGAARRTQG